MKPFLFCFTKLASLELQNKVWNNSTIERICNLQMAPIS